jgi:hypothetical protein
VRPGGGGHGRQALQFGRLSTLKQRTPACQRLAHLVGGLADAGEHHPGRVAAGGEHARQFTAETMSKPQPARAKVCSTARLELAFIA